MPLRSGILFVCTGNICRSPTAEASSVRRRRVPVSSRISSSIPPERSTTTSGGARPARGACGAPPRLRHRATARAAGCCRGLPTVPPHLRHGRGQPPDLERDASSGVSQVISALFLDLVPELGVREVPDPYYGGPAGFEEVLNLVERASEALVTQLAARFLAPSGSSRRYGRPGFARAASGAFPQPHQEAGHHQRAAAGGRPGTHEASRRSEALPSCTMRCHSRKASPPLRVARSLSMQDRARARIDEYDGAGARRGVARFAQVDAIGAARSAGNPTPMTVASG